MAVTIPDITPKYPSAWPSGQGAQTLVAEKFEQTAENIDEHLKKFPPLTRARRLPTGKKRVVFSNVNWGPRTFED